MKLAPSMTTAALAARRSQPPCTPQAYAPAPCARRPNVPRARLAAVCASALLAACVTAPGPGLAPDLPAPAPAPLAEPITVHILQGSATVQRGVTRSALHRDTVVEEGQPIQVGAKSYLQLNLGKRALFELGPNARLVVHKRPRIGDASDRATWLRLERGYLRVIWSEGADGGNWPLEVSFSRWAAKLGVGEYFFDSAADSASACAFRGDMRLSGVPETTPRAMSDPCVSLYAASPPRLIALRAEDWGALRSKRALEVTLKNAAAAEAAQAIAELERQMAAQPPPTVAQRIAPTPPPPLAAPTQTQMPMPMAMASVEPAPAATARMPDIQPTLPEPARDAVARVDFPLREPPPTPRADPPAPPVGLEVAMAAPLPQPRPPPVIVIALPPEAMPEPQPPAPEPAAPPLAAPLPRAGAAGPAGRPPTPQKPVTELSADPVDGWGQVRLNASPNTAFATTPSAQALEAPVAMDPNEWIVNVASYSSQARAEEQVRQLAATGIQATVRAEIVRGRSSYRVVIDGLPSETAALGMVSELDSRLGLQSAWVLRRR